jgi:uncharacterized protein (TIGR02001 family)
MALAFSAVPVGFVHALSVGGDLAVTTDYVFRGYSETNHKGAAQLDLHVSTQSGTFVGVWTSTLDRKYAPFASFDMEEYIGQRFDLSSAWNTSITATNYQYLGANQYYWSDYQQLAASVSYLDRWTLSVAAIPNMLRYSGYYRAGRHPAYTAEMSGQWNLFSGFFITGGVGYFLATGESHLHDAYTPPGAAAPPANSTQPSYSPPDHYPSLGYAYGNVGVAYEWRSLRLDVAYFLTQKARAERLQPYPTADNRVAGTLSWRF